MPPDLSLRGLFLGTLADCYLHKGEEDCSHLSFECPSSSIRGSRGWRFPQTRHLDLTETLHPQEGDRVGKNLGSVMHNLAAS